MAQESQKCCSAGGGGKQVSWSEMLTFAHYRAFPPRVGEKAKQFRTTKLLARNEPANRKTTPRKFELWKVRARVHAGGTSELPWGLHACAQVTPAPLQGQVEDFIFQMTTEVWDEVSTERGSQEGHEQVSTATSALLIQPASTIAFIRIQNPQTKQARCVMTTRKANERWEMRRKTRERELFFSTYLLMQYLLQI